MYGGEEAFDILTLLRAWGMTHLSIGVCTDGARRVIRSVQERGWQVDVWDVEDAVDLERALAMDPGSITADLGAIPVLTSHAARTA